MALQMQIDTGTKKIQEEIIKSGVIPSQKDYGIFYKSHGSHIIWIPVQFVDDILWGGNAKFANLIDNLKDIFPVG